jgi:dihydroorotate dehydrogenase electron transfer subunit
VTAAAPAIADAKAQRGTLFVEDAEILSVSTFPGEQFITRLHAPQCARHAVPGSFVHVQCDAALPMRRPLSIMRVEPRAGWIEVLYKIVGAGLQALATKQAGDRVSIIGPIGRGFRPSPQRKRCLLIGGGVGIPPMIFLAEHLKDSKADWQPLVLMGSEIPFPFELQRSACKTDWLPPDINRSMPLLEEWRIPSRLASLADFTGVYRGYVTDLAREWLSEQDDAALQQTEIFACGPTPMLRAVAALARDFALPCQVSLEEFMACGVGGCAGCTVLVQTDAGPAMKKVCVEGPVFEASSVFFTEGA